MPTIEIISVGVRETPNLSKLDQFALRASVEVESDRVLFSSDLQEIEGCIIHLGKSQGDAEPLWFCGHSIDWDSCHDNGLFQFETRAFADIQSLVSKLMEASPVSTVYFLTDIQMEVGAERVALCSVAKFIKLNSASKLRLNTLYKISEP